MTYVNNKQFEQLTPYQVYKFFATSEDAGLRDIAKDLKSSFNIQGEHEPASDMGAVIPVIDQIMQGGQFLYGANAVIALAVFGDRTKTGGSYNKQIQAIKADLMILNDKLTTTTT